MTPPFENLESHLRDIEFWLQIKERNRIFLLALPPSVSSLSQEGSKKCNYSEDGTNRIIVEKPFGKDLESSRELLGSLKQYWPEDENVRLIIYLGKRMVKTSLYFVLPNIA